MSREIDQAGLDLIEQFEGLRLTVYNDAVGKPTIGYGHLIKPGEDFTTITQQQAEDLLRGDLAIAEGAVESAVTATLSDNQFAACVSFVFNLGAGNFRGSTLLKLLNAGDYQGAADQFLKWDHAGGKALPGLTRRRQAERQLFLTPDAAADDSAAAGDAQPSGSGD